MGEVMIRQEIKGVKKNKKRSEGTCVELFVIVEKNRLFLY